MPKSIVQIKAKITLLTRKLDGKPVVENFGDREIRQLDDYIGNIYDYPCLQRPHINELRLNFNNWCGTYNGKKK